MVSMTTKPLLLVFECDTIRQDIPFFTWNSTYAVYQEEPYLVIILSCSRPEKVTVATMPILAFPKQCFCLNVLLQQGAVILELYESSKHSRQQVPY